MTPSGTRTDGFGAVRRKNSEHDEPDPGAAAVEPVQHGSGSGHTRKNLK